MDTKDAARWYRKRPGLSDAVVLMLGLSMPIWDTLSDVHHKDDKHNIAAILNLKVGEYEILFEPCECPYEREMSN